MKAILEFNLPEEQTEFEIASNAQKTISVLWNMNQWLRKQIKYAPDDMSKEELYAYNLCRDELHSLLNEHNINLD